MPRPRTKRDLDILEQRGLWKASAFLDRLVRRLVRKRQPLEVRHLREAHRILFTEAGQREVAGKYRRQNLDLKRIDGTPLPMAQWRDTARHMMALDAEVRAATVDARPPKTDAERAAVVQHAALLSHQLALIHPFENGNGRVSRLLMNAVLLRAGLPLIAIKADKPRYLRAMRQADDGDLTLLEGLIVTGLLESQRRIYRALQRKKPASRRRQARRRVRRGKRRYP